MEELALNILDIIQNSIRAKATKIELSLEANQASDQLILCITDNGKGMDAETVKVIESPFVTSRTTRKVGLGISLIKQAAEQTGGTLKLESELGKGTKLKVVFGLSHVDRQPVGDLAGTLTMLIAANPSIRFIYTEIVDGKTFVFDTDEVKKELEDVPINHPDVLKALKEMIESNRSPL